MPELQGEARTADLPIGDAAPPRSVRAVLVSEVGGLVVVEDDRP